MNIEELRTEIERTMNNTLEIINLRKEQIKNLQDFIKNEESRLQHFKKRLAVIDNEKSE